MGLQRHASGSLPSFHRATLSTSTASAMQSPPPFRHSTRSSAPFTSRTLLARIFVIHCVQIMIHDQEEGMRAFNADCVTRYRT